MTEETQEAALRARIDALETELRPLRGMKQEVDKLRARAQTAEATLAQREAAVSVLEAKVKAADEAAAATTALREQLTAAEALAEQRLALGQAEVPAARWGTLATLHGAAGVDVPIHEWIAAQKATPGSDVALLLGVATPSAGQAVEPPPAGAQAPATPATNGAAAAPPSPPSPAFRENGGVVPPPAPTHRSVASVQAEAKANPSGFLSRLGVPAGAIPKGLTN